MTSLRHSWGRPQTNRAVRETPLAIGGRGFERGVGTHAASTFRVLFNRGTECFVALVGVDAAAGANASVIFQVLADGSRAVGLCNAGEKPVRITARWSDLGLAGPQRVRDVWHHRELGEFRDAFHAEVRRHGVRLVVVAQH